MIESLRHKPRWFLGLVLFGFFVTIGFILLGAEGAEPYVGPASFLVSLLSLAVAIPDRPRTPPPPGEDGDGGGDGGADPPGAAPAPLSRTLVGSAVVLLVGIVIASVYATTIRKLDLRVTDQLQISKTAGVVDGDTVDVRITPDPDGRRTSR